MAIWQVVVLLDTSIAAHATDLANLRSAANTLSLFVQKQIATTQWTVTFNLDDSNVNQANILAAVYAALSGSSPLTAASITKIG